MSTNQKKDSASKVQVDARKLLRAINSSAQSKVAFFEESVKKLGSSINKDYRLTSVNRDNIIFEDIDSNTFYMADTKKLGGGKYRINNIKEIEIIDDEKPKLFEDNCKDLVESLAAGNGRGDIKAADKIWRKIESQRFRSKIIPESGFVTTKDGITRKYKSADDNDNRNARISQIVEAIVDLYRDNVDIVDNKIICGVFSEDTPNITLPVDEFTCRRVVARKMKSIANEAYKHPSFQRLIKNVAGHISNGNLKEAVSLAGKFFGREQEFCLLKESEMLDLVDKTLATQRIFNPFLIRDTAKLVHATNLTVNGTHIVESWTKTAQLADSAVLMEAADTLRTTEKFAKDYDRLLDQVFNEDHAPGSQELMNKAYAATLHAMAGKLARDVPELASDLKDMAASLSDPNTADASTRQEAEAILGAVWTKLGDQLSKYDEFGGDIEDEEAGMEEEMAGEEELGEPIEFAGDLPGAPELGGEEEEFGGEPGLEGGMELGGEPGMGGELGGMGGEMGMGAPPPPTGGGGLPLAASKQYQNVTYIEDMNASQLKEEYDHWQTDGHIYLREDGFDNCFNQMKAYVSRCDELGLKSLRENFEKIRDHMVETGTDVLDDIPTDRYDGSTMSISDDIDIDEDYISEDSNLRMSKPWSEVDSGGQGEGGLVKKGLKSSDGTSGTKAAGTGEVSHGKGKDKMSKGLGPHKGQGDHTWDELDDADGKDKMSKGAGPHGGQGDDVVSIKGKGPKGQQELNEGEEPDDMESACSKCGKELPEGSKFCLACKKEGQITDDQYHWSTDGVSGRPWGYSDSKYEHGVYDENKDGGLDSLNEDLEAVLVKLRSPGGEAGAESPSEIVQAVKELMDMDMDELDEFEAGEIDNAEYEAGEMDDTEYEDDDEGFEIADTTPEPEPYEPEGEEDEKSVIEDEGEEDDDDELDESLENRLDKVLGEEGMVGGDSLGKADVDMGKEHQDKGDNITKTRKSLKSDGLDMAKDHQSRGDDITKRKSGQKDAGLDMAKDHQDRGDDITKKQGKGPKKVTGASKMSESRRRRRKKRKKK